MDGPSWKLFAKMWVGTGTYCTKGDESESEATVQPPSIVWRRDKTVEKLVFTLDFTPEERSDASGSNTKTKLGHN